MAEETPPEAATAEEAPEKRVGWAELYFDLVFVVAVTRVAALIEHRHDGVGLLRALIVFIPIYWTWVGASMLTNQNDAERPGLRLRLFAVALAGIFMSLAVEDAYADTGVLLAVSYWAGRLVLASTILKPLLARSYTVFNPYVLSAVVTGPLLVVGSLLDAGPRTAVWAIAAMLDLGGPTLFRSRMRLMHFDAAHLSERFGLFVLIALGERSWSSPPRPTPPVWTLPRGPPSPRRSWLASGCGGSTSTSLLTPYGTRWPPQRCSWTSLDWCSATATWPSSAP